MMRSEMDLFKNIFHDYIENYKFNCFTLYSFTHKIIIFNSKGIILISVFYIRHQRAQEERSRRNTNRYYDESASLVGSEINGNYRNSTSNNHSLSSSSSYLRRGDPTTYIPNSSSTGQQHAVTLNSYGPHPNMLAAVNGSTQTHLAYYQTNPV